MAKLTSAIWQGLKKDLQNLALGITGKMISIHEIDRSEGEIGYTSKKGGIHLAIDNEMFDTMTTREKVSFITGVFAHELMHKIATDFMELERVRDSITEPREAEIFWSIANVVEDPSIEAQAKYYFGGWLLKCLHRTIMVIFRDTPPLGDEACDFTEYMNAMIMYGDGGIIKGKFRSAEAKKYFYATVPLVDRSIDERDAKKRIKLQYEIFLKTKPLWEDIANQRKMMDELRKLMKDHGKSMSGSGDRPMPLDRNEDATDPASDKKQKRRKATYRKISKEEMEALLENGGPSNGAAPDGDVEILYCDEDVETPEGNKGVAASADGDEETKGADTASTDDGDKASGQPEHDDAASEGDAHTEDNAAGGIGTSGTPDYDKEATIDDEEYELSASDIERIDRMIEEAKTEAASAADAKTKCNDDDLSAPNVDVNYSGVRCLNRKVNKSPSETLINQYDTIVNELSRDINTLYNQIRRIIANDAAEREYRNSGRINVGRVYGGRVTSRLFERNIDPANKANMCVELLVDISGSMNGDKKWYQAMLCTIGLAEVFAKLHITCKVIGFTADTAGYDVLHYHYMHWLNTKDERLNLLNLRPSANNFDGYSIRYATEMLKRRKEEHKILFVLSDGAPACHYYCGRNGIADTSDAIRQATKHTEVIGVGIGDNDDRIWRAMYQSCSFIQVKTPSDLFTNIGVEIQKIIRKW